MFTVLNVKSEAFYSITGVAPLRVGVLKYPMQTKEEGMQTACMALTKGEERFQFSKFLGSAVYFTLFYSHFANCCITRPIQKKARSTQIKYHS
jgi:hypothetical protein